MDRRTHRMVVKRITFYETVGYQNLDQLAERVKDVWLIRSESMEKRFEWRPFGPLTQDEEHVYLDAAHGVIEGAANMRDFVNRLPVLQMTVDMSETKLQRFVDGLEKFHKIGKGCLVFFVLKAPLFEISRRLSFPHEILTGETSQVERFRIKDEFTPETVILCTSAAARSYNFQAVNTVVFYTIPFEVEVFAQMVGRVARPFVSKYEYVRIITPYVRNTIDEYRIQLMQNNADLIKQILSQAGSPNLPESAQSMRRQALIDLRKNLLWRNRNERNLQAVR